MKRIRIIIAVTLALLSSATAFAPLVHAQEDQTKEAITVSPAVVRPVLKAGQKATGKITIINNGSVGYTFLLYARPFSVSGENYNPNFTIVNERTEAYQWVQFDRTKVRLEPNDRTEVGYTVQTPPSARGGGHYAVLFAETQPPEDQPASVVRKKRVGTLLYMRVGGSIDEKGEVESWTTTTLQTKKPVTSNLRLKNTGNIHYEATVQASYSNMFGKELFNLNQQLLIMPGTTRRIAVEWQKAPYLGIFRVQGRVTFLGNSEPLPSKYVVLIPYTFMIGFGLLIVLVILGLVLKHTRRKTNTKFRAKRR